MKKTAGGVSAERTTCSTIMTSSFSLECFGIPLPRSRTGFVCIHLKIRISQLSKFVPLESTGEPEWYTGAHNGLVWNYFKSEVGRKGKGYHKFRKIQERIIYFLSEVENFHI